MIQKRRTSLSRPEEKKRLGKLRNVVSTLFLLLTVNLYAQQVSVSGTVTDATGEALIGANVTEKGTSNGVITDLDGNFSLSVASDATLLISYIGYTSQEIKAIPGKTMKVILLDDTKTLDEVVVVGYGTMKKSDLTGAVVSANLKDFEKSPNTNIMQSLQGTVPGLNVGLSTTSGGTPEISIRGTTTLSGKKDVLIVLDGIIYTNSLSSINPNDIASIDVLKDASSTAVYGAQAANGVLLITTKRGKAGKTKVSFSTSYTFSNPTRNLRPMNREEFLAFSTETWYDKAYLGPDFTTPNPDFRLADYLPDAVMKDGNQPDGISANNYNWWDEGTQTASIFENKLTVSGGSENTSFLISFANTNQKGFIVNDDFKRNSIRVNLDTSPFKWMKMGVQAFGSFVNQDGAEPSRWELIRSVPLMTPYDKDGKFNLYPWKSVDTNPFMGNLVDDRERHNYFFANIYAEIKLPVKGLTYRFNYGNNYRIDEHYRSSEFGAGEKGEAYKRHTSYHDYTFDNILNYNADFGRHSIGATFVYGASERKQDYTDAKSQEFPRLLLGYNSLEQGAKQFTNSDAWDEALLYQMLRVNYRFDNKYLLTATVRRDGFSGFAENNKFATFPSVSLAWIISEEDFFNVSWMNNLKLRAGWGVSGNQTARYKSLAIVESKAGYVFGNGGTTEYRQRVTAMANPNLKWEKTGGYNIGIDFGFFGNRLAGSLEAYRTTTRDLLYDMVIPTVTGFSKVPSNIGKIRNQGIELNLISRNITTKDFSWETTFNISHNSNKILSLLGRDADGDGKEDDLVANNLFIGESTTALYGYKVNGIYQLNDDIPAGFHPGNYRVVDVTGEGDYNEEDRVILGKKDPAYRLGLMNKFRYKDFSLSFFINSVQGGKDGYLGELASKNNYLTTMVRGDKNYLRYNRISKQAADYWSPNNPGATYSRAISEGKINPTVYQDRSFIRLQDVTFSYNLPQQWIQKIGIESLDVYASAKNLITITDWKGWDPEPGNGAGYWDKPVMRSFSFGLNVTF